MKLHMRPKRHKTKKRGIYYVDAEDGTRSYIATWKEEKPLNIGDPLTMRRRTVEKRADTFDEACLLQAKGEAVARRGKPPQSLAAQLGDRMMAAAWFRTWVRR